MSDESFLLSQKTVRAGKVAGVLFWGSKQNFANLPALVVFNQWRSGAASLFSRYLAELVLQNGMYGSVLCVDRIASGGASQNTLSAAQRRRMRIDGDFQFSEIYSQAIQTLIENEGIKKGFVIGGSSAGVTGALAAASQFSSDDCLGVVLVEPGGLRAWGIGHTNTLALPHAMSQHVLAYRHRLQRGWWTPMDREQYLAKGPMFERRAQYLASDRFGQALQQYIRDPVKPRAHVVLSATSHAHRQSDRHQLQVIREEPHVIHITQGKHDILCQPPSLTKYYSLAL